MSPKLFITVHEYAFKQLEWEQRGINIDGKRLNNLRFADDIVLIADDIQEAQEMLTELANARTKVGLQINTQKTKIMTKSQH